MPRCKKEKAEGLSATLGTAKSKIADGGDDIALPFAPEVGGATPLGDGFVAGVLVGEKQGLGAVLTLLSGTLGSAKIIDLGKVHGDVLAPEPRFSAGRLIVAVSDGAPNGTLIRLARVEDPTGSAHVKWGAEILEGKDESDAFAFEVGAKTGVVAWDEWAADGEHSVVRVATFPGDDVSKAAPSIVLSGKGEDAESPLLAQRPGGFWIAWMTNEKREPTKKERAEPSDNAAAVDLGPRSISLLALDEAGKPTGSVLSVTHPGGHVLAFDLVAATDGGALVAYRDDKTSPGTAGGAVHLSLVHPDGAVDARVLTDEDVGAEVPALLSDDAAPPGAAQAWLSLGTDADTARLVALDGDGRALDDLAPEPALGVGAPLAVHAGKVLAAEPRGQRAELSVFSCSRGR